MRERTSRRDLIRKPGLKLRWTKRGRLRTEIAFRIGVQVLSGVADAPTAGAAFADLADAIISGLARAALTEVERAAGAFDGEVAVIALGKCGSREMSARSDLDLMTLYQPASGMAASVLKGWSAETFYARFTQRLVAALSAPTREGELYDVDLQLRPSGTKGPVAVSAAAFERYYEGDAETWELLALTRARVVWASSDVFATRAEAAIEAALRRPRDLAETARDVVEMRDLMARERPPSSFWDVKLSPGGLVDIEFCTQFLQLVGASEGGVLRQNTVEALTALAAAQPTRADDIASLLGSWRLQQSASQLLKIALDDGADPVCGARGFQDAPGEDRWDARPTRPCSRPSGASAAGPARSIGAGSADRDGTRFIPRSRPCGDSQEYGLGRGDPCALAGTKRMGSGCGGLAGGDAEAVRALVAGKLPRVLALARRMLNDPVEAEDVAQETFVKAWRFAPSWRPGEAKFDTWLHRVALNLCYDRLRRRKFVDTAEPPDVVDEGPAPDRGLHARDVGIRVDLALAALPDRQREAIVLCHYQELGKYRGGEGAGDQRRGVGEPARPWAAGPAGGVGRSGGTVRTVKL